MDKNISAEEPIMVSIRCITYNHEPYIRQCLEGFVMQKTNFRFEAIVHDDASTDHTADIIREYAEKYPNIIKPIYETENQYSKHDGALRRALDNACKGKYFALCEGDDYWTDPYKLQKQVDFMEGHSDVGYLFTKNKRLKPNGDFYDFFSNKYNIEIPNICDLNFLLKHDIMPPTQTVMYKRELLPNPFPAQFNNVLNGDWVLYMLIAYQCKIGYINEVTAVYRENIGVLSKGDTITNIKRSMKLCNDMNKYTNYAYNQYLNKKEYFYERLFITYKNKRKYAEAIKYYILYHIYYHIHNIKHQDEL